MTDPYPSHMIGRDSDLNQSNIYVLRPSADEYREVINNQRRCKRMLLTYVASPHP